VTSKINMRESVRKGRVFDIFIENVTLPNQSTVDFEIIRHPGAAAIVALTEAQRLLMLKQYRHAIGDYLWEIPAGTLEKAEDVLTCARRELVEETGFSARSWQTLGEIVPVPGYSDERIHLFMARDLTPAVQQLDRDEVIEVHQLPLEEVFNMVSSGQIIDAKTICGVSLARQRLSG
jgi:ADP-ribose pyrophosphatase